MRDMTEKQFQDALARHGYRLFGGLWVEHKDNPNTKHGLLHRNGVVARRASLSMLLKEKAKHDA